MEFGRAFSYAFDDENWSNKLVITAIIGIIPIVNLAVAGWALDLVKNMLAGQERPMPDWNDLGNQFTGRWVAGLMAAIAFFVYYLPWIVVEAILNGITGGILGRSDAGLVIALSTALSCGVALLGALYSAVIWLPYSVGLMRYSNTRDFSHFFQFARNIEVARTHLSTLITLAVFVFLARIVLGLVFLIPCIGWLLALFSATVMAVVLGHLVGQAAIIMSNRARGAGA